MKTLDRVLLGLGAVVLLAVGGATFAGQKLPPRISWNPDPLVTDSIKPGESATYTVKFKNTGFLPIPATKQLRVVPEGPIEAYVTVTPPKFPPVIKRGDTVTLSVTVKVPKDAPVGVSEGELVLKRYIGKRVTVVWRAEGLPVSITVRGVYAFNDTGITRCGNAATNDLSCPQTGFPGQDAQYGRDLTHNDDSDGHAGFSFTKLDANGYPLAIQNGTWDEAGYEEEGTKWSCVQDNVTGRIWEVKTNDGGLRDKDWTYTWYNSDPNTNGGDAGTQNGGTCAESACDTDDFVEAVNAQGLCGASDWRLPDPGELFSILALNRSNPPIDLAWFPNTPPNTTFWSSSPSMYPLRSAFNVSGGITSAGKDRAFRVRLVRAGE